MNPLTLVKRTQAITSKESALGISEEASWHAKYKDSAYVFVGGIPFDLTEGDLLAVFAQYGEIVDVNLVRDKATGKSRGFAFVAYEDQRSTILAVDNLNGAKVLGRIVRVDHVSSYKKKEEEDEETRRQKREARGVCRAFQKGECNRGDSCKFSHDQQRAANTGWGPKESDERWGHDRNNDPPRSHKNFSQNAIDPRLPDRAKDKESTSRSTDRDGRSLRSEAYEDRHDSGRRGSYGSSFRDRDRRGDERLPDRSRSERKSRDDGYTQAREERPEKYKSNRDDAIGHGDAKRPRRRDGDDDEEEAEERHRKSHR